MQGLVKAENRFLRNFLALGPGTPMDALQHELGTGSIGLQVALPSVLYWVKIWTKPELEPCLNIVQEVESQARQAKLPWYSHVANILQTKGCADCWAEPKEMMKGTGQYVKERFWQYVSINLSGRKLKQLRTLTTLSLSHIWTK
ncbi:hypothetical protein NDU88_007006 [Pleurodeles waltl]|uniref:Uncharacterized protein n=1 Tax=Pleurodeles waltl TaxID=8319 RepID=A0AAV7VS97_PLEWA|nr:hypothetical protein NDU88_007006 [Pleurodeles waltl]